MGHHASAFGWLKEIIEPEVFKEDLSKSVVERNTSVGDESTEEAVEQLKDLEKKLKDAKHAREVAEAEKSIEYLKQQVANTSLADLQAMFFELIQSQTETVMLAEVRPEYVFKTIDPAV